MLIPLLALVLAPSLSAPNDVEELVERYDDGSPKVVREVRRDADGTPINHGAYTSFHPTGKKESEGRYVDGTRTGEWIFRWENGRRREAGEYVNGKRTGLWKQVRERGGKEAEGWYVNDHRHGEWTFYDRKGEIDPTRSGFYEWIDIGDDAFFYGGTGARFNGLKSGPWTLRWPNGVVMAEGTYAAGTLQGELAFFRPDGTFEPELFSGQYRGGRRLAPLTEAPPDRAAGAEPFSYVFAEMQPTPLVDAWLDGSGVPADTLRTRILRLERDAVPSLLDRLVRCDLETREGRDTARRVHGLLVEIFGGHSYAWNDEDTSAGHDVRRRAVQRWQLAWIALANLDTLWIFDFGSARRAPDHPGESFLLDLPLPDILALPEAIPAPPPEVGEAAEAGGKLGGRRHLRAAGGAGTEQAVANGLFWLVAHQEEDGHWDCAAHGGSPYFDVGVTAQALLALLDEGNTPVAGEYHGELTQGLLWLLAQQDLERGQIVTRRRDEDGSLRTGPEPLYEHLLATQVLAEAASVASSPLLQERLQLAVDHFLGLRNAEGIWEFAWGTFTGDCSVTVSAVIPLRKAVEAGITIDALVFDALERWLDAITDETNGHARSPRFEAPEPGELRFSPDRDADITATVLLARFFLGQRPDTTPVMEKHAQHLRRNLPQWNTRTEELGMHHVHDGSYAMFLLGARNWKDWNQSMKSSLLSMHLQDGEFAGSWDPLGPHGRGGGRVLATALATRTLQVYYHGLKMR